MSAHKRPYELAVASYEVPDPGTGNAITYSRWGQVVPFTIAASATETNTLAAPLNANQRLILFAQTVGASGTRTVTVASAINSDGDLTLVFNAVDDVAVLTSVPVGSGVFEWRVEYSEGVTGGAGQDLITDDLTVGGTLTLGTSVFDSDPLATLAGTGITGGTGTVYKTSVIKSGSMIFTTIYLDLTGLQAIATDGDVIGDSTNPAHLGRITAANNGTIESMRVTCEEAPAGASADIDFYRATVATAVKDDAISGVTGQATTGVTNAGAWTNGLVKCATAVPAANDYLYIVNGAGANAGTFTAGKFRIELIGY